jgi:putative oxidoreductase
MCSIENKLSTCLNEDIGKLLLRLSVAVLMLFHGVSKAINGIDGIKFLVDRAGLPEFVAYGVYFGEIVVPLLLIFGLFTRISALVFVINMIFAILLAHSADLFALGKTGGLVIELPLFYLLGALVIFFIGAGKYSLDNKLNIQVSENKKENLE